MSVIRVGPNNFKHYGSCREQWRNATRLEIKAEVVDTIGCGGLAYGLFYLVFGPGFGLNVVVGLLFWAAGFREARGMRRHANMLREKEYQRNV